MGRGAMERQSWQTAQVAALFSWAKVLHYLHVIPLSMVPLLFHGTSKLTSQFSAALSLLSPPPVSPQADIFSATTQKAVGDAFLFDTLGGKGNSLLRLQGSTEAVRGPSKRIGKETLKFINNTFSLLYHVIQTLLLILLKRVLAVSLLLR